MSRENNFLKKENISKIKSRRKLSAEKVKEIYIQRLGDEDYIPLKIAMNKTVKDLKREIEKLYNLNYSLDDHGIKVCSNGMKGGFRPIEQSDEGKSLFDNKFTSGCTVSFGDEKNEGG